MSTEPWYDPVLLDQCFNKFHEGEAYIIDADQFSLPDESEEVGLAEEDFEEKAAAEDSSLNEPTTPIQVDDVASKNEQSILEKVSVAHGQDTNGETTTTKRLSGLGAAKAHGTEVRTPIHAEEAPKSLKSHASSSTGSQPKRPIAGFSVVGKPVKCFDSPASAVDVRQKNYKKTGQKAPSETSLYECVGLDILRGKKKVGKVCSQVTLPWVAEDRSGTPVGLPKVLMVVFQLPNKGPAMFRSSADTDPGTSLVFYLRLRQGKFDEASVRLATKFFSGSAPGRFKVISFIDNLSELKFPSMLMGTVNKFNGKPIIVNKTGSFYNEKDVFEVDVDVFQFPVLGRTALNQGRSLAEGAKLRIAFVLQAETEDELPERLLGCCELRGLDIDGCAFDRFN